MGVLLIEILIQLDMNHFKVASAPCPSAYGWQKWCILSVHCREVLLKFGGRGVPRRTSTDLDTKERSATVRLTEGVQHKG